MSKQASSVASKQVASYGTREKLSDIYELFRWKAIKQRERGAERFGRRAYNVWHWMVDRAYMVAGISIGVTNWVYYTERSRREEVMANIEENRRRFYGKSFSNDYMPYTPSRLYDGPIGYVQVDPITGIKTNADGRITAPNNKELAENLRKTVVTDDMVKGIEELHGAQYSAEAKKNPKPLGKAQWTGFM